MKNLIFNAFAYIDDYNTSVNIDQSNTIDIYMKNIIVSLYSAKISNPNDDIALITNIEVPKNHMEFLNKHKIKIIECKYDTFLFPKEYSWSLAFYKLCALKYAVKELGYDNYALLDADTVTIHPFNNIWRECRDKVLLFDMKHSLEIEQAKNMNQEYLQLYGKDSMLTNYGGEFIAFNQENGMEWIRQCEQVYRDMLDARLITKHGDEFITCCVAHKNGNNIKNANAYIERYWTNRFYLCSTNYYYNPVTIVHVPDEKNLGMLLLYNYIVKNLSLPDIEKIARFLSLQEKYGYRNKIKRKWQGIRLRLQL